MWTWVCKGPAAGCSANAVRHARRRARVCVRVWMMVVVDRCVSVRVRRREWVWIRMAAWQLLHRPRLSALMSLVAPEGARRACRWRRRRRRCMQMHLLSYAHTCAWLMGWRCGRVGLAWTQQVSRNRRCKEVQ